MGVLPARDELTSAKVIEENLKLRTLLLEAVRELKLARGSLNRPDHLHPASELILRCRQLLERSAVAAAEPSSIAQLKSRSQVNCAHDC
jgi:hypothetical protein